MKRTLGQKLYDRIEMAQGYSYISDGVRDYSKEELYKLVKNSIEWHKKSIEVLKTFQKMHLSKPKQ